MDRREFLKSVALGAGTLLAARFAAFGQDRPAAGGQSGREGMNQTRILIPYFSKTGNTQAVARQIQAIVGGDLLHVTTKKPYPENYQETTRIARAELDNNERPELAVAVENIGMYDIVFFGYPIWWGTIPMALFTFLEQHDLSGKTVIPFCTHGGSALGRSVGDIEKLCPNSTIGEALAIRGTGANQAQQEVANWLRRSGVSR